MNWDDIIFLGFGISTFVMGIGLGAGIEGYMSPPCGCCEDGKKSVIIEATGEKRCLEVEK